VQADIAMSGGLTSSWPPVYTQARYTEDFRFATDRLDPRPLVAKNGDAIRGCEQ